jgi:branched-chain amino acid transport system substrate-binding protein
MKIVCLNWCADELFIKTAGPENAEGHIMIQPFAPYTTNAPGLKPIDDYLKTKGSSLSAQSLHYTQGWYTMDVMAKGIEKAAGSSDKLTGESIRNALQTMDAVDTGGVVGTGKVQFSAESHRGSTGSGIYQVKAGQLELIAANQVP